MKKSIIILFLVLFSSFAFSEGFKTLQTLGYSSQIFESNECKEYSVGVDLQELGESKIFFAKIQLQNPLSSNFKIKFFEDDVFATQISQENLFNCEDSICNALVELDNQSSEGILKICPIFTNTTKSFTLLESSEYGFYKIPNFPKDKFRISANNYSPQVGADVNVTISLENTGSAQGEIEILSQNKIVDDKSFRILIGDTSYSGVIPENSFFSYSFLLRIEESDFIGLPPAVLTYTDRFGKENKITSNLIDFNVQIPIPDVEVELIGKSIAKLTNQAKITALVRNNSLFEVKNLKLEIFVINNKTGTQDLQVFFIDSIPANSFTEKEFLFTPQYSGEVILGCKVIYLESQTLEDCKEFNLLIEEDTPSILIPFTILLVLIGILAYIFINQK